MTGSGSPTLLAALGISPAAGRLYDRVRAYSGTPVAEVADSLEMTAPRLRQELAPLRERGVVEEVDDTLVVLPPAEAVTRVLAGLADGAQQAHARLVEISRALPELAGSTAMPESLTLPEEQPLDGEVIARQYIPRTVEAVVRSGTGGLRWLRPDQWALPWEDRMTALIAEMVAAGRRCRAIYPVRALRDAPLAVAARVEAGEEIRVLPEVPTRMLVVGSSHALLPEPLGAAASPRLVVRQPGLVDAMALLFERLWVQAAAIPELSDPGRGQRSPAHRRFLLEQLAEGAQDEQIARRLGVSLRTVRRRVAEVMTELNAESRFQAGVEAVRRGWL